MKEKTTTKEIQQRGYLINLNSMEISCIGGGLLYELFIAGVVVTAIVLLIHNECCSNDPVPIDYRTMGGFFALLTGGGGASIPD